ncbi:MAG: sensor for high-affinity potassium transporter [Betaproteobacteria bacterium HGW-Betaproteobacteria-4]|jgi:two-component system sensor histidine kinase KdpD|nr:MAG: sensor for high-affinity potassium transporter [Betaproteobacteria bacterium HGW-Betaproteobacteria-4]
MSDCRKKIMNSKKPVTTPLPERFKPWQRTLLTVLACAATTLLATPLLGYLDLANIVMLFLLTVLLVAITFGRGSAVLASILGVLLFDIFFVPPRFSLAVENIQYLVTFAVMLITGLITGQLAAGLKQKAREAQTRERRTQALYDAARQLAGALTQAQVVDIARNFTLAQLEAESLILLPDEHGQPTQATSTTSACKVNPLLANIAEDSGKTVRNHDMSGSGFAALYLPLRASMRTRGVLAIAFPADVVSVPDEHVALLEALASLIGIALERLHYVDVAQSTQLKMVSERLRSSILSALSHDLRTPLTALVGLADSLFLIKPALPDSALETAQAMHEQAARLANLVGNLLDMARLNAGEINLRREWQPLEEVIGASIKLIESALISHPVKVSLPPDLPLLEFDAVLLERVFCNLLENAAKYAPPNTHLEITARPAGEFVEVAISDRGPGFAETDNDRLFDMFVRGDSVAGKPGTGLGLAICRAIVEAHGGTIRASNRPEGGACVSFTLPRGTPPVLEEESV